MKSVIIVVALCLALALSQSVPSSSNPAGASYFSSALVGTLGLNQTVSSSLYNTSGNTYQEFWKVWVPSYVGAVRYTVNNTGSDINYVEVQVNFIYGHEDSSIGFPCEYGSSGSYGSSCYSYDTFFEAYTGESDYQEYTAYDYFQPGQWQFVTVNRYYSSSAWVNYTLRVEATFECPNTSYVVVDDLAMSCISNSNINNVTTNGATYTGSLTSTSQMDVYRVSVPQNVSRVWAWVTSSLSDLEVSIDVSDIPTYYYNYHYDDAGSSMTGSGYSYYVEYDLPPYGVPAFVSVAPYSTTGTYNISIHWSACGASMAGYGDMTTDYSTATSSFPYVADCSDPVSVNNFNPLSSLATVNFALPAYNSTSDNGYAGSYAFMYIPTGTVGSLNFTCNSTSNDAFVVATANGPSDCSEGYTWYMDCTGPSYSSYEYLWILSEDLYPGGYWSIAACSYDSSSATVSLVSTGSVAAGASVSPSPGSDNGTGGSGGSSSNGSSTLIPALLFVVLAAMFAF